jgi:hypothetical protein
MKFDFPVRFHTIEDLAERWKLTRDEILSMQGELEIIERPVAGEIRKGVTPEERARFEDRYTTADKPDDSKRVKTLQWLLGAALHLWNVRDPERWNLEAHYTLHDAFSTECAKRGIRMLRGKETGAETLRDAVAIFRHSDCASSRWWETGGPARNELMDLAGMDENTAGYLLQRSLSVHAIAELALDEFMEQAPMLLPKRAEKILKAAKETLPD